MRPTRTYKLPRGLAHAAFVLIASGATSSALAATTLVAQHSDKCLGVTASATTNGAVVEQQTCTGAGNQSWTVNDTGGGQYELIAGNSGKCLEVKDGRTDDTAPVQQGACTRKPAQQWRLRTKSPGVYEIVNFPSGRCLDVIGGEPATGDGVDTELWHCTGFDNEAFALTLPTTPAPQSLIVAKHSGKCLDVTGGPGGTENGRVIEQWQCNATTNQQWTLVEAGVGLVQLKARNSNKCVEALDTINGAAIQQMDCAATPGQQWSLQAAALAGEYKLVHAASGRCLDVVGGPNGANSKSNGQATELWNCTGTSNQTWTIRAISSTPRDPLKQPFAVDSIWNMPIGSGAVYVPSGLLDHPGTSWDPNHPEAPGYPTANNVNGAPMPGVDKDRIILTPTAPPLPIWKGVAYYGDNGNRCATAEQAPVLYTVPVPATYDLPSNNGNDCAVFLMPNGYSLVQTQPFVRCRDAQGNLESHGVSWTTINPPADEPMDLYTGGRAGSHGGSKLSALGGTLRKGELTPNSPIGPRHALKVDVYSDEAFFRCDPNPADDDPNNNDDDTDSRVNCFRWPALVSDHNALDRYGRASGNQNLAMRMGALLAIPPTVDIDALGLQTEPGRQIAWTMQNYGAYVVDSTGGPGFNLTIEDATDAVTQSMSAKFIEDFGFDIVARVNTNEAPNDPNYPNDAQTKRARWRMDMQAIVRNLHVVDNNGPTSIGGGGTPLQPLLSGITHPPMQ